MRRREVKIDAEQAGVERIAKGKDNWCSRAEHGAVIRIAVGLKNVERLEQYVESFGDHGRTGANGALATALDTGIMRFWKRLARKSGEVKPKKRNYGKYVSAALLLAQATLQHDRHSHDEDCDCEVQLQQALMSFGQQVDRAAAERAAVEEKAKG